MRPHTRPKTTAQHNSHLVSRFLNDAQIGFTASAALELDALSCSLTSSEKASLFAWEVFNAPFWRSEVVALQEAADFLKDKNQELAEILAGPTIQIFKKHHIGSDRKRREALAFLLGLVLKHGAQTDQGLAHEKLCGTG